MFEDNIVTLISSLQKPNQIHKFMQRVPHGAQAIELILEMTHF